MIWPRRREAWARTAKSPFTKLSWSKPRGDDLATFRFRSGKGFYIRALVRDLAAKLGVEGHVWRLRRTAVQAFTEAESVTLDELQLFGSEGCRVRTPKPAETALDDIPALAINGEDAFKLQTGTAHRPPPAWVETLKPQFRDRFIGGVDASRAASLSMRARLLRWVTCGGRFEPSRVFNIAD